MKVLMINRSRMHSRKVTGSLRSSLYMLIICGAVLAVACGGGDSKSSGSVGLYSPGSKTDEDVDKELKFDARVDNYTAEGDKLVVNVNTSFASAPPGIQQRALGH